MFDLAALEATTAVVRRALPPTPTYAWPLLAARAGCELFVKHENHTPVGAFKVRGGLAFVDELRRERPEVRGLASATRGNHGQSLAFAGRREGLAVVIAVPRGNSAEKNAAMRALGAEVVEAGRDFDEARPVAEARPGAIGDVGQVAVVGAPEPHRLAAGCVEHVKLAGDVAIGLVDGLAVLAARAAGADIAVESQDSGLSRGRGRKARGDRRRSQ